MPKYTTGEIAKICGVTVRTVQYYDTRGILIPSELTEGGRRVYTDDDLKRMKIICFLRELGLSIDSISQLFSEKECGNVISLLLEQQVADLREEISEREDQLRKLTDLKTALKTVENLSVESIGDIAYLMTKKKELKKVRRIMLLSALPVSLLEIASVILWIWKGAWWLFLIWVLIAIPWGIVVSRYYYKHVAYICPHCHTVFKPAFREVLWAQHTPATRKLTCTACGQKGFCVEVAAENEVKDHA